MRKHRAQIVFTEASKGGYWEGRLLNASACIDETSGERVTWKPKFDIEEEHDFETGDPEGYYVVLQGGRDPGGRRYSKYPDLATAQAAGIRWAARRFYVDA